jgi:hypothetical protein
MKYQPKKAKDVRKGSMRKGNNRTKYILAAIELAIQDIQGKWLSLNKAAKHYNVPKATLSNRINQFVQDRLAHPTELKKEEEEIIVERLMMMGGLGFVADLQGSLPTHKVLFGWAGEDNKENVKINLTSD